jgi:phosphate transport system substrate-binding protein
MGRFTTGFLPHLLALILLAAPAVHAADITLRSADSAVELSGELLDFDGEFYRIRTKYGDMTLNARGVICHGLGCPDPGQYAADLAISGTSDEVQDMLPGLIEAYAFESGFTATRSDHGGGWTIFVSDRANVPVARIQARAGTDESAFADLASGTADLIITTRRPTDAEAEAAIAGGAGDPRARYRSRIVALDGLAFIVNRRNPITSLGLGDLTDIYSGTTVSWDGLGAEDVPIRVLGRAQRSDLSARVRTLLFNAEDGPQPIPLRSFPDNATLADAVAADPFALGYATVSTIGNARALSLRGTCGMRIVPSRFAVKAGDYPLLTYIHAFTPERRLPVFARGFLTWLDSDSAQEALARMGRFGLDIDSARFADQNERVANAIRAADQEITLDHLRGFVRSFSNAARLSTTFRFSDNSTDMDERSSRNVALLARRIEDGDFDGRELVFAGFSDSVGGAAGNRRISRQRAEQVADLVRKAAARADLSRLTISAIGLGEISPLACNDDELGRRINRRVEVWLR